jgi:hypothetical protein
MEENSKKRVVYPVLLPIDDEEIRRRLAGHLQCRLHEHLPGSYFSPDDVDEYIVEFFKLLGAAPNVNRDTLISALAPWSDTKEISVLHHMSDSELYARWVHQCSQ